MAQTLTPRKLPMRKCTGCAEHFPKMELIRVLRTPEGAIVLDTTGKKSGRGAYLCNDINCINKCVKTRAFNRSFKQAIPQEFYEEIVQKFGA